MRADATSSILEINRAFQRNARYTRRRFSKAKGFGDEKALGARSCGFGITLCPTHQNDEGRLIILADDMARKQRATVYRRFVTNVFANPGKEDRRQPSIQRKTLAREQCSAAVRFRTAYVTRLLSFSPLVAPTHLRAYVLPAQISMHPSSDFWSSRYRWRLALVP